MSQMINVSLKGMDLLNVVVLFLFTVSDFKLSTVNFFFYGLTFGISLFIFEAQLLNRFRKSFIIDTGISIIV